MKLAIIGAGPSGLSVLKEAIFESFQCTVFEQSAKIGGIWNYSEDIPLNENGLPLLSGIYDGMITNVPKETMAFEDFPYKSPDHSFISHHEVHDYINDFVKQFNLLQYIHLNTQVTLVEPIDSNKWLVRTKNRQTEENGENIFDAVIVCNGHLCNPHFPAIPGRDVFKGDTIHSVVYRKPDRYKGKNVLVIGGGPSGADISRMLVPLAKKVFVCFNEKSPCPLDAGIVQKSKSVKHLTENTAVFEDESEEVVDSVIFCSGYNTIFPFLSQKCGITVEKNWVKPLYKHMININKPTMAFINLTDFTITFPLSGLQARFFFAFLKKKFSVSYEEMIEDMNQEISNIRKNGTPLRYTHRLGPLAMENYCENLAETAGIKNKQVVANTIFKLCICEGFKKHNYRIISDKEFEKF